MKTAVRKGGRFFTKREPVKNVSKKKLFLFIVYDTILSGGFYLLYKGGIEPYDMPFSDVRRRRTVNTVYTEE